MAVEDGDAVVHLGADGIGYLFVFLRENHELHGLSHGVVDVVEYEVLDDHGAESEGHLMDAVDAVAELRDEEAGSDDEEVDHDEHLSQ